MAGNLNETVPKPDVWDIFVESGRHGGIWPKLTYVVIPKKVFGKLICIPKDENEPSNDENEPADIEQENKEKHTEIKLLDKLRKMTKEMPLDREITIYINYSPCANCSLQIDIFFKTQQKVNIIFAQLYKIARPSCQWRKCNCTKIIDAKVGKANVDQLRILKDRPGWTVRPFGAQDWLDLAAELGMTQIAQKAVELRRNEDRLMAEDFFQLFPVQKDVIYEALEALTPYSDSDYVFESPLGNKIKVRTYKDFKNELGLIIKKCRNQLRKSECPHENVIEKVVEVYAGSNDYAIFISQTLALDLNLPLKVFPPCKLTTVLFLVAKMPCFLLSLYDIKDKAKSEQVLSYTHKMSNSLLENLFRVCRVKFVIVSCCMQSSNFDEKILETTVTERFDAIRQYENGDLFLTPDTLCDVTAAAHTLAGSVDLISKSPGEETSIVVEMAWRNVLSLLIEKVSGGIQSRNIIKILGDTVKLRATINTIRRRQDSLRNNKSRNESLYEIHLNGERLELPFTEGDYESAESEHEWISSEGENDESDKEEKEYFTSEGEYETAESEPEWISAEGENDEKIVSLLGTKSGITISGNFDDKDKLNGSNDPHNTFSVTPGNRTTGTLAKLEVELALERERADYLQRDKERLEEEYRYLRQIERLLPEEMRREELRWHDLQECHTDVDIRLCQPLPAGIMALIHKGQTSALGSEPQVAVLESLRMKAIPRRERQHNSIGSISAPDVVDERQREIPATSLKKKDKAPEMKPLLIGHNYDAGKKQI